MKLRAAVPFLILISCSFAEKSKKDSPKDSDERFLGSCETGSNTNDPLTPNRCIEYREMNASERDAKAANCQPQSGSRFQSWTNMSCDFGSEPTYGCRHIDASGMQTIQWDQWRPNSNAAAGYRPATEDEVRQACAQANGEFVTYPLTN